MTNNTPSEGHGEGTPHGEPTGEHEALRPEILEAGYDTRASHGAYRGEPYAVPPATTDSNALMALLFAISSFVLCPVLPAIAAVAMAPGAKRRIRHSNGRLTGMGLARAAQWLGWINIIVVVLLGWLIIGLARTAINSDIWTF